MECGNSQPQQINVPEYLVTVTVTVDVDVGDKNRMSRFH